MAAYVNGSMLVSDIINDYPETIGFLIECGMQCIGCPASQAESLYEACRVHDLDTELVIEELNQEITAVRERT